MGPPQVEAMLRDVLAFGVDDVLLVTDRAFAGADTLATSYTIGRTIEKLLPDTDLVIFGKQAIDGDTAQVGPGVAEYLGIPQMIYVIKVEGVADRTITVRRELEDGYEVIKAKLPAAITVLKDINTLRMPSLKGKMKARTATIRQVTAADLDPDPERLGLKGSPTWVSKIFTPPVKGNRQLIQDDQGSAGKAIFDILKNLKVV
jgi:electron transfer flavoprotein beta subunit